MVPEAVGSNPISHPKQPKNVPQGILRGVFVSGGRAEFTRARLLETKTQGGTPGAFGLFWRPRRDRAAAQRRRNPTPGRRRSTHLPRSDHLPPLFQSKYLLLWNIYKVPPPCAVEFIQPASTSKGTSTKPHRPAPSNSSDQPALHKEHPQSPTIQPTCTPINAVLCEHF